MTDLNLSQAGLNAVQVYEKYFAEKTDATVQYYPDEMVVRAVRGRFKPSGIRKVLDAGCGEGRHAIMMAHEGLEVTGLDASASALKLARDWAARQHLNIDFHQASITCQPFESASFDAVICWRLLYYLTDAEIEMAMAEFRRVLKSGGVLYLSIPTDQYCFLDDGDDASQLVVRAKNGISARRFKEDELNALFHGFEPVQYGMQAQSFLGAPHKVQLFWHVYGQKS